MYQSKKSFDSEKIKPNVSPAENENGKEISFTPFVIGVKPKNTNGGLPNHAETVTEPSPDSKKVRGKKFAKREDPELSTPIRKEKSLRGERSLRGEISIITEYAATRRVNIILFSLISLIGVFIGIMYAKDIEPDRLSALRESGDIFFSDISMSAMTVKILTSVLYSAIYIVVIFLSGFTIFAPVVSAAANLIKSALFGFMTAALIFTAGGKFDAGIAALYILFGTAQILILSLASGEALGFSVFLLKNEESYKKSLSFPNVSLYSVRHIIFLILMAAISVLETVVIPLMYDLMY